MPVSFQLDADPLIYMVTVQYQTVIMRKHPVDGDRVPVKSFRAGPPLFEEIRTSPRFGGAVLWKIDSK